MLYFLALARLLTASPILSTNTSSILSTLPTTLPTTPKRWTGDCESYCSSLFGNKYYPCMQICPLRLGDETDTDHPSTSDFLGPNDRSPWLYVTTDSPSTSDRDDWHHRRGLGARSLDGEPEARKYRPGDFEDVLSSSPGHDEDLSPSPGHDEDVDVLVSPLAEQIDLYASVYHAIRDLPITLPPPIPSSLPSPVPPTVDASLQDHILALRHALSTHAPTTPLTTAFLHHVRASRHATSKYFARRFEVLARRDLETQLRRLTTGMAKRGIIRERVREEWGRGFGVRVWAPRGVLASVDFE